jgi:hypothetical protein
MMLQSYHAIFGSSTFVSTDMASISVDGNSSYRQVFTPLGHHRVSQFPESNSALSVFFHHGQSSRLAQTLYQTSNHLPDLRIAPRKPVRSA